MQRKFSQALGSALPDPTVGAAASSPVPEPAISNKPPPGQTGPRGMQPRQTYSRVNTGSPSIPDAGSSSEKSTSPRGLEFLPKTAEVHMRDIQTRPSLNDMIKAAMEGTIGKVDLTREASRFVADQPAESVKQASSESVSTDFLNKLADAVGYIANSLEKAADIQLSAPSGGGVTPGEGPGALGVSAARSSETNIDAGELGSAKPANTPPKNPPTEASVTGPANAMATNESMQHGEQPVDPMNGKQASAAVVDRIVKVARGDKARAVASHLAHAPGRIVDRALGVKSDKKKESSAPLDAIRFFAAKTAEDAINPAKISAGAATPPTATKSEEGVPTEPADVNSQKGLIASNQSAIDYKKQEAKRDAVSDAGKLLNETPMKDPVLDRVFDHSGQAGVKTSMAGEAMKIAAARALLNKLAEEACADSKGKKEKNSQMGAGGGAGGGAAGAAPPPPGIPSPAFTQ